MNETPTKPLPLPQAPRMSLVDSTIAVIRTQIESGAWSVDERIPREQELAEMLQVGRNTVREAIRVLSHAKVLEVRQGDGTYVRSNIDPAEVMRRVTRSSIVDHLELRTMLETEAAKLAARHRSRDDIALLYGLLDRRGESQSHPSYQAFIEADLAFHIEISRISGNTALAELYRYFALTAGAKMRSVLDEGELPEPPLEAHIAIVRAIEAGNEETAAEAAGAVIAPLIAILKR